MTHRADRLKTIQPFYVMDVLGRAKAMEAEGKSVIHLEIGEPDFPTPAVVVQAGIHALEQGHTHYTAALGLAALRERIAQQYAKSYRPSASQIVITPGASGALQLVFAALLNAGDKVLMTDPGYPCNRNFVTLYGGAPVAIPVQADTAYQLTADSIKRHWDSDVRAVLLASPSNPTGTVIADDELGRIVETVAGLGGVLIVDEIYHGLIYGGDAGSVLKHSNNVFVVNSFSKYYGMTGWRLGWLVTPSAYLPDIEKLAQNMFIASSTIAQHAALTVFEPEVIQELEQRRDTFRQRRDYLLPALRELGFEIPIKPQGAFYLYADCQAFSKDSFAFVIQLLEQTGVAITPGRDFGVYQSETHVRFSYANTLEHLREAVQRIRHFLQK
ncbi:MAG TPA: pyridoxal phosphate-dependent aminotransferase [Acidiferrobacteraceae bacterium]|nr:pyridoxal phosphate-dependent aminotransferase [Acidiferrobacteraceae bacterium]HEX20574.1 pyridoxal phosphate-dependent aminotransferase [Acidiferrobacteraceae bacterium]